MVGITPVPDAPRFVLGVVDLGGTVMPVVDLRSRFNYPPRGVRLSDHLIVATTATRTVALVVDATEGVIEASLEDHVSADEIMPRFEGIEGMVRLAEGLVLIHDLERLLSGEEQAAVDRAVAAASGGHMPEATAAATKPRAAPRKR